MQGGEVTPMRFYFASRLNCRPQLHEIRTKLRAMGHDVIASWLDETGDYNANPEQARKVAMRDLMQIATVDIVLLDTTSPISKDGGGGREVEFGFAIAQYQHKKLWRVGPAKNVFHFLAEKSWPDWNSFLEEMNERK